MEELRIRAFEGIRFHLSVRRHDRGKGFAGYVGGNGLRDGVHVKDGLDPRTAHAGRLTIWIHGYNNPHDAINRIWHQTAASLSDSGVPVDDVVSFYWPGDQWPAVSLSAFAYPLQIDIARKSAARLASYLTEPTGRRLHLHLVAHSLGCLVALELVRLLDVCKGHDAMVQSMLLMAAAVPQGLCISGVDPYGHGSLQRDHVLYSGQDKVLKYAFRTGQRFAEYAGRAARPWISGAYRIAVGREGGPTNRWTARPMTGHDHGDYWLSPAVHEQISEVTFQKPPIALEIRSREAAAYGVDGRSAPAGWPAPRLQRGVPDWRAAADPKWSV